MKRCPQCESLYCGQFACRFSGLTNDAFLARKALLESNRINDYADAMIENDRLRIGNPHHDLDTRGQPLKPGS